MYNEKQTATESGTELTIDFGKNGLGLSDELIKIGEIIKELSEKNTVVIRDSFIDELDDVYQLTFFYYPKS